MNFDRVVKRQLKLAVQNTLYEVENDNIDNQHRRGLRQAHRLPSHISKMVLPTVKIGPLFATKLHCTANSPVEFNFSGVGPSR